MSARASYLRMVKRHSSKGIIHVAVMLLGLGCCVCQARVVNVNVSNGTDAFAFFPAVTNITAGDSVLWTWVNINHSVSNTAGLFSSKVQGTGTIYVNTFNSVGTFPYQCTIHHAFGMTGSIIVAAAPVPPAIAITNPVSGAVFAAPASVTIQAAVTSGNGSVTNVQFLVGSGVLTNEMAAPFSALTNNLIAGSYTLSAIATDTNGLKATNATTISVVTPVTVGMTAPARPSWTNFQFSYTANVGLRYLVQRSTNLLSTNWLTLATNVAATSPVNFSDTNATVDQGFYRIERLPNP